MRISAYTYTHTRKISCTPSNFICTRMCAAYAYMCIRLYMGVCVCVLYIYIYMYIYIYIYVYAYVCIYIYIDMCIHLYAHTCAYKINGPCFRPDVCVSAAYICSMSVYTYTHIHTNVHVRACACVCVCKCIKIYACVYSCGRLEFSCLSLLPPDSLSHPPSPLPPI